MLEPIGISAGVLALTTFAFKSTVSLYETVQGLQNNHKNIRQLKQELKALNNVIRSLQELPSTENAQLEGLEGLEIPLRHCGEVCRDFERTIKECTKRTSESKSSFRDFAKLKYKGKDIADFKDLLAIYKSTISIAMADGNLRTTAANANAVREYKDTLENTTADLQDQLERLAEQFEALRVQESETADAQAADREHVVQEISSINECLAVCDRASERINQVRTNEFEHVTSADDAHQVIVSTFGDLISARRVSAGAGATQWLGQMSDASLQQLIQTRGIDMPGGLEKMRNGHNGVERGNGRNGTMKFQDRYGSGHRLDG